MLNTLIHHCEAVLHLRFQDGMMVTCSKVNNFDLFRFHLPTYPSPYFSLRAKCWLRWGVGGQFPRNLNWSNNFLYSTQSALSMKDTVGSCIVGCVSQSGQVKCTPKGSINEFVIDWMQRGYCKKFTAHYRCRKADLNLIMSAANGFIFQVTNLLVEPMEVCLTVWRDCKVVSNFIIKVRDRTRNQGPGVHFSKSPETFQAQRQISKSKSVE